MVSHCKQFTLQEAFSGRLRRVGEEARKTDRAKHSTTLRMPVFSCQEFLELKSPRTLGG